MFALVVVTLPLAVRFVECSSMSKLHPRGVVRLFAETARYVALGDICKGSWARVAG